MNRQSSAEIISVHDRAPADEFVLTLKFPVESVSRVLSTDTPQPLVVKAQLWDGLTPRQQEIALKALARKRLGPNLSLRGDAAGRV